MGIVRKMQNLLRFFMGKRQSGSTTLLNKIAKENDVYVLVHNMEMSDYFDKKVRGKIYTPDTVHKLKDAEKKPILIDNALFHQILTDALLEIGSKEEIIEHQKNTLSIISQIITESNRVNPHNGRKFAFEKDKNYNIVTFR